MRAAYLACLLFSLTGMVIWDNRRRLVFFRDARRAWPVVLGCLAAFLAWDALGIATGTFYRGESPYMLGVELAPELPVEEPVFLFFLTYLAMNLAAEAREVARR